MSGCVGILLESRMTKIFLDDSKTNSDFFFFFPNQVNIYCEIGRLRQVWALEPYLQLLWGWEECLMPSESAFWGCDWEQRDWCTTKNNQSWGLDFSCFHLFSVPQSMGTSLLLLYQRSKNNSNFICLYVSTQYTHVWKKCLVLCGCPGTACFLRTTKCSHPSWIFLKVFNKELI